MATKKRSEPKECTPIKIKYIFKDEYNPVYANGAYGGPTPSGEIVVNFYFERHALPNAEILKPDNVDFEPQDLANSAVRFIENGVILSPNTAEILAKWLLEQVNHVKNIDKTAE